LLAAGGEPSAAEADPEELSRRTARLIKKVTEDLEGFRFNTGLATLMEHTNYLLAIKGEVGEEVWQNALRTFTLVLAPFAPHHAEEMWALIGLPYSVHEQAWPAWDEDLIAPEEITLVIQVNGKLRDRIEAPASVSEDVARELALASSKVRPYIEGREIRKSVYVPGRLLNFVVG
jgi:leucyl-tRNA synthetase